MSAVALQRPCFLKVSGQEIKIPYYRERIPGSWKISANSSSSKTRKELESSEELQKVSLPPQIEPVTITTLSKLQFDRLQQENKLFKQENILEFGQFFAREAFLDEEYWTAAWLRAESHWEDRNERFAENYKRKFAEQEFNALKRRSRAQLGHKSTCIVAVKKENRDGKRTVVKSVVGTLDLSIQYLSVGEIFPGVRAKTPLFCSIDRKSCHRYGYISNLCVAKSARRLGIASNMLLSAIKSARVQGAEQVFVHVHRCNTPAKKLYHKMGFEEVEAEGFDNSDEQIHLLRLQTHHEVCMTV